MPLYRDKTAVVTAEPYQPGVEDGFICRTSRLMCIEERCVLDGDKPPSDCKFRIAFIRDCYQGKARKGW